MIEAMETPDQMRARHRKEWDDMTASLLTLKPAEHISGVRGSGAVAIMRMYADSNGFTFHEMYSPCRQQPLARVRQDCMKAIKDNTKLTISQIGRLFKRDHTTVLYGIRAAEKRVSE